MTINPTTDELIRVYSEVMGTNNLLESFWKGRLEGRLDVLENFFSYTFPLTESIPKEIAKIKEVLK